jgi:hypothetical protein
MPSLIIQGRSLDHPADTAYYTTSFVAGTGTENPFWPSGMTLQSPGRWLLVGTSATNWSCFIVTVKPLTSPPHGSDEKQLLWYAEDEGARYLDGPIPATIPQQVAGFAAGTDERRCVRATNFGPVRSGQFLIGGQLADTAAAPAGTDRKVWWMPVTNQRNMPPLIVRGRNIDHLADTVYFSTERIAESEGFFWPTGINLPTGGRWLLIATSGTNWGCFILTTKPATESGHDKPVPNRRGRAIRSTLMLRADRRFRRR